MLASIWLSAAGLCLIFWYKLCKGSMRRALGIDPFRSAPGEQGARPLPLWLLIAGQVTLLVGVAPMYSTALLLRFGLLPALLWTVLGDVLLGTLPYFVTLWATLRSGGKSIGGLMYEYLGGRGKQALSVLEIGRAHV
jgi:carbon starvation protein